MESPSFVSKARTAFHSAAAKAERVLSDLKQPDRPDSDKTSPRILIQQAEDESPGESRGFHESKALRWRPPNIGTKQEWQDRKQEWQDKLRNIGKGKKGVEDTEKAEYSSMAVPYYDENLYILNMKNDMEAKGAELIPSVESLAADNIVIPPLSVMRQLATAVEAGKKSKSMKDLLASSGNSSPVRERGGLSLSAVKSLVLREKEEKPSDFGHNEKVLSLIHSLFDAEGNFLRRKIDSGSDTITMASIPKDIHGAPPESLVVKLAEVIGSFRTLKKMTLFWCSVVSELRRLWSEEAYVPSIPVDEIPDLNSCLLYQRLQVINCCVSRKRRRDIATETLEFVIREASPNAEESSVSTDNAAGPVLYARISTGELVLRLGADRPYGNLKMLETGEPMYTPVTQEGPLLTEDLIKETEEFVLRTGSVGAGCSQLLSDMQAFKAANPGCILEDFVRWHSPPDWTEAEPSTEAESLDGNDVSSARGQLSSRMQKAGNLWHELWDTSKPVPAVKQVPLFDEDLAVVGAGCSQLLSDMQAFKAANPGCILEDFVRWHSPPDWTEAEPSTEAESLDGNDVSSARGQLSSRMQKAGNLWHELWDTSKPVPAVKQVPLFDEDLAVEGILDGFEDISPSELFEQLFISLLGLGFVIAEAKLSTNSDFSKLFYECKDFVVSTCQGKMWTEKVDELCQVFETVEAMILNPEEVLRIMKQPEETMTPSPSSEPKSRFRRLTLNFGGKDRQLKKSASKDQKNSQSPGSQPFSSFFDNKSSLFSKKPPKPESASPVEKPSITEDNDWTVV